MRRSALGFINPFEKIKENPHLLNTLNLYSFISMVQII